MSLTTARQMTPQDVLRKQLTAMGPELATALPSNIAPEKFRRVVMTVAQQNPDLIGADRKSLLGACMKCAADGLIPDGREAALVLFSGKVQYMPMMGGLLKRARNSGEIASVASHVVYKHDEFTIEYGDDERLIHKPKLDGERGEAIGAYAVAKLKDGSIVREWMSKAEIEKVRAVSRSKNNGPWAQWWDEMARKTVWRRLSKWLPMDADAGDMLRRDDDLGKPGGDADAAPAVIEGVAEDAVPGRLDVLEGSLADNDDLHNDDGAAE